MLMISVGLCISDKRHLSCSPFDPAGTHRGWAFATRNQDGVPVYLVPCKKNGGWTVKPVEGVKFPCKKVELVKRSLSFINGMPHAFLVELTENNGTVYTRNLYATDRVDIAALRRGEVLSVHAGYYPTLLVSLIGPPDSGKTVYTYGLQTAPVFERLRDMFREEILHPEALKPMVVDKLPGSPIASFVLASFIVRTKRGPVQVLLGDLAGEVTEVSGYDALNDSGKGYDVQSRLVADNIINNVAMSDAVLEIRKGRRLLQGEEHRGDNLYHFLTRLPEKMLRATVVNESGLLLDHLRRNGCSLAGKPCGPGSAIFEPCLDMEDVYRHAAVAGSVARSVYFSEVGEACFFVDSCTELPDDRLDFGGASNVEVPFAWILSRLLDLTAVEA